MTDTKQTLSWPPIENNPEVLTALARHLGLSDAYSFCDVYAFEADLLAFIPRPAKALLLVAPLSEGLERLRKQDDVAHADDAVLDATTTLWAKQTIRNACGTMAILHSLLNLPETLTPEHPFTKFAERFRALSAEERVQAIEQDTLIHDAHAQVAGQGQSAAIAAEEEVTLHFIAFVKNERTGHLIELDGGRAGPIDHGLLETDEDVLCDKAVAVVQRFMQRAGEQSEDISFSLCALTLAQD